MEIKSLDGLLYLIEETAAPRQKKAKLTSKSLSVSIISSNHGTMKGGSVEKSAAGFSGLSSPDPSSASTKELGREKKGSNC